MRRLSPLAALMILNAYCGTLLGLVLWALDPATDWTLGFLGLMLFFCCATGPALSFVRRLALGDRPGYPIRRTARRPAA